MKKKIIAIFIICIFLSVGFTTVSSVEIKNKRSNVFLESSVLEKSKFMIINSAPSPPFDTSKTIVTQQQLNNGEDDVILSGIPTSSWHYGCSATAVAMIFSYYDNIGYGNLYNQSIPGSLDEDVSIVATEDHINDYWIEMDSPGPDPWEKNGTTEHKWADCPADFMGTNQWKWIIGGKNYNHDGGTILCGAAIGYDYIPQPDNPNEKPATSISHGMRLFAESRGYELLWKSSAGQFGEYEVYTQKTGNENYFTLHDFQNEIDNGYPVMLHIRNDYGWGHSMVGVGYKKDTETIFLHNSWDNNLHQMNWTGEYPGTVNTLGHVTVMHLSHPDETNVPPDIPNIRIYENDDEELGKIVRIRTSDPNANKTNADEVKIEYKIDWGNGTVTDWLGPYYSGQTFQKLPVWKEKGTYIIRVKARDEQGLESEWSESPPIVMSKSKSKIIQNPFCKLYGGYPKIYTLLKIILNF